MAKVDAKKHADECGRLANERFGLQRGMMMAMEGFNCNDEMKMHIVKAAQDRRFDDLKDALSIIGNDKPYYVRIKQ